MWHILDYGTYNVFSGNSIHNKELDLSKSVHRSNSIEHNQCKSTKTNVITNQNDKGWDTWLHCIHRIMK